MMTNPVSCLICSRDLDPDLLTANNYNVNSRKRSQFREGLHLFCKLLKISGNYVDKIFLGGGGWGNGEDVEPPCCEECWKAFEQMVRLQQAIELMQANLMEQLEKLKVALVASIPSDYTEDPLKIPADDIFGKIRDQLLSYVRNSSLPSSSTTTHQPSKKRRGPLSKTSKQQYPVVPKNRKKYQPCSVILQRLPDNLSMSNTVILIEGEETKADIGITFKQEPTFPEDSTLAAMVQDNLWRDPNDQEYSPSPIDEDNLDDNPDDEEEYPWESEAKPITENIPNQLNSTCLTGRHSKFSLITHDTLLYNYTLIKVSQGYTHFTCQEPQCPSPHFSDPSLNWNSLFNQLADHIKHVHGGGAPLKDDIGRKCPLCPLVFPPGPQFRSHLVSIPKTEKSRKQAEGHRIETIVCELCWKPIRNTADAYRCHLWYHQNNQEMEQSPEGLPPSLLSRVRRGKSKKLHKLLKSKLIKRKPKLKVTPKPKMTKLVQKKDITPNKPFLKFGEDGNIKQEIIPSDDDPSSDPVSIGGRGMRKSKLKALEFIQQNFQQALPSPSSVEKDDCNFDPNDDDDFMSSPSPEAPSPLQDNLNDNSEDESPEAKPEFPVEKLQNQLNSTRLTSRYTKFSLISPDILLYQYTLIKVTQGYTHFTCQEPDCRSPNFSESPLNWNNLFNQLADHIQDVHSNAASEKTERKCPLCPITFTSGPKFRSHLVSLSRTCRKLKRNHEDYHQIDTIVCELCLKPIRNMADAYRCHFWKHLNDQEKMQSPEGLPPTLLSKLKNGKCKKFEKFEKLKNVQKPKKQVIRKPQIKNQSHTGTGTTLKRKVGPSKGEDGTIKIDDHFCRILEKNSPQQESLLLHKYTLLKALYGISLTCQELNCDFIINGTDFTSFEQFKDHVKNCHTLATRNSDTIWKCPLCPAIPKTAFGFRRHLLYNCPEASSPVIGNFRFICTVCWRPLNSSYTLEYHQWLHKSDIEKESAPPPAIALCKEKERQSNLKCGHCQREFSTLHLLKAHEATHVPKEDRKKYMCHQCPRLFLSPVAVRAHVEREHERELMRLRTCPICGQQFNWRNGYSFRRHLRSHRNERPFVCDLCGKAFYDGLSMKKHKRQVHELTERCWQCEFCEMRYTQSKHLKRHKRNVHKDMMGEEEMAEMEQRKKTWNFTRPEFRSDFIGPRIAFPCPGCEKVFQLRSRMRKHWEKSCKLK